MLTFLTILSELRLSTARGQSVVITFRSKDSYYKETQFIKSTNAINNLQNLSDLSVDPNNLNLNLTGTIACKLNDGTL